MPGASGMQCASGWREFSLTLHPEKTRLVEFGRFATPQRAERGLGKPETFNFLGFTFICGRSRHGKLRFEGSPGVIACGRSSRKSRMNCDSEGISLSRNKGNGCGKSWPVSSLTMRCRRTAMHSARSDIT